MCTEALGGGSWWSKCLDDASTLAGLGEVGLDCLGWKAEGCG